MDPEPQTTTESLLSVIAGLTARLNQLESQTPSTIPIPDLDPAPTPAKPKKCLPDIALFSGKRSDYLMWSTSARQKLQFDGAAIGGAAEQHAYLFSRMEASAQNLVAVYFTSNVQSGRADPQIFLTHLDTIFLDPNAARRALSKLYDLRQRTDESFSAFLPRFERLLQEAQITDQRTAINVLERSLNPALAEKLVMINIADNEYAAFVQELHRISSRIEQFNFAYGRRRTLEPPRSSPRNPDPNAMDWEPAKPLEVRNLGRLTEQDRERLRANGACFRCRQPGHLSRSCPQNARPSPVTAAALTPIAADQGNDEL